MSQKTVLITGVGAGALGYALTMAFYQRGFCVIATHKYPQNSKLLEQFENIHFLEMDVTSAQSISMVLEAVSSKLSPDSIEFLVNNAGYGYAMPLIEADIEEAKKLFDVNVWGALAVTQAFAPLLQKVNGTVANIGSIGGIFHSPWIGIYSASKAALICISETMRLELRPLGINVITFLLGTIKTTSFENSPRITLAENSAYKSATMYMENAAQGKTSPMPMDPKVLGEQLVKDMVNGASGKTWRGGLAWVVKFWLSWVPTWITDAVMFKEHGLYELQQFLRKQKKLD